MQGLPGPGSREGEGGISDAAFGLVFPLAGNRCVPRTGVRLYCPLGVAPPASLPCLSLLPHSGATWFSYEDRRAGLAVDGGKCRGGVDCPNGGLGNFPSGGKCPSGNKKSFLILFFL